MEYSKLVYEGQYCSVKQFLEEGNCKDKYYVTEDNKNGYGYYYIDCDGKRQRGAWWFTILGDAIEAAQKYDASAASWSITLGPGIKPEHLQRIAAQVALGGTEGVIE